MWSQLLTEHLTVPNEASVLKLKKEKETNIRGDAAGMKVSERLSATEGSRSLGWRKSTKLNEGKAETRGSSRRQTGGGYDDEGRDTMLKGFVSVFTIQTLAQA